MRRRVEANPRPLLQRRETTRLMTLLLMLAVIGMLMIRARDPKMWAMFANVAEEQARAGDDDVPPPETGAVAGQPAAEPPANPLPVLPALDEDSEEQDSLQEEFQVVTDKEFFQTIEMPAYYRLLRWVVSQPVEELQRKAIKDPRFGDIFTRPEAYRGKLVDIRLHVMRVLKHKDVEADNPAGVTKLWEIFGYNDSSGQNSYIGITPELSPDMTVGSRVIEEGRFVGYFIKLMAYEDAGGKMRASPVFIGRFIREKPVPQKTDPEAQQREFTWGIYAAAVVALVLLVRWGFQRIQAKTAVSNTDINLRDIRRRLSLGKDSDEENLDIETWLDQTGPSPDDPAINRSDEDESDKETR